MSYAEYLRFYNLEANEETRNAWLWSLWCKGLVYQYNGEFFDIETGKKVG